MNIFSDLTEKAVRQANTILRKCKYRLPI